MSALVGLFMSFFTAMGQNAIATENALPGNPKSEWDVSGSGDLTIQGFATDISVNKGGTVHFKINTDADAYSIDIYRLGFYNGLGARKVGQATITAILPQVQPGPLTNTATGLIDCGNWAESASWDIPGTAVSGVYIARLVRANGGASHVIFIVRDDAGTSDIIFQTSDQTWNAFNSFGGNSFYEGNTLFSSGRAVKISYNRPLTTRQNNPENYFFNAEYPMLRWLERNGYDLSYMSGLDGDRNGSLISHHKVYLSVGHDEYWSAGQRFNVTAARDAGTHLAFFSGNEIYFKTRWENSIDGTNTPYRTLVCYKEGTAGDISCSGKCDPITTVWTGAWRNGCNFPAADGCKPENALTGQLGFNESTTSMDVPFAFKNLRFWRNTSITTLTSSQTANLTPGTVGNQMDYEQTSSSYPVGRVKLSKTTIGGKVNNMTFYKNPNRTIVFGAGSVQYSWGLDSVHDRASDVADIRMQQGTVNLLADMKVQPSSLQSVLVAGSPSTDTTAPASKFSSLSNSSIVVQGQAITVKGTSSDIGGVVAGIEVSFDGGNTWKVATGTNSWTVSWTPSLTGSATLKVRGIDDSGNLESSGTTNTITVQVVISGPAIGGTGGPILLISTTSNPFSGFSKEIMQAQGFNEYYALDINQVNASVLALTDVVVLGQMTLTSAQVSMLTDWTTAGGTLIALRPPLQLSSLLGLTPVNDSMSNKYLLVTTSGGPGAGIVNQSIQYHGAADLYNLNGANILATLYSDAGTASPYPAVTQIAVGAKGGQAIAFTYDLARSVVYTRQGNPAWAGQERDGVAPIRSNDLFTGVGEPDWIDFNKIAIPQADEQMHLLTNIIINGNLNHKPLPRFWFLPRGFKAAIVMTGDDHAIGGTIGRFNQYVSLSTSNTATAVADWDAIRSTSYIYSTTPITNAQVIAFQNQGFEIAVHLTTSCADFTTTSIDDDFTNQLDAAAVNYPGMKKPVTNRTHCIPWSDWSTHVTEEIAKGIRFDVNYYYWPGAWIQNRPGMFTGSGVPMKFADLNGTILNCYQVPTQLTDESGIDYTTHTNALLDKATGPEGYYGVFATNMHTDFVQSTGSDAIISSARAHGIPVVSSLQMLTWLDGRNNSSFDQINWNANQLSFVVNAAAGSRNLQTMVPMNTGTLRLVSVTGNGSSVPFNMQMIKGIQYAFFPVASGNYVINYNTVPPCVPPVAVISSPQIVCPGQPIPLTLSSSTGASPFSLVVNGINYNNVTVGQQFASVTFNESSIWPSVSLPAIPAATDNTPIETGVKFRSSADGQIMGIRFYKGTGNSGTHVGSLWSSTGTKLASATFTGETATGWQTVRFTTPVIISANTTYIASYYSPTGIYAYTGGYFSTPFSSGPLTALQNGTDGPNGVYLYGSGFPNGGNGANYWVDVLFKPSTSSTSNSYTLTNIIDNYGCSNSGNLNVTTTNTSVAPAGTITTSGGPVCKNSPINLIFKSTSGKSPFSLVINNTTYNNIVSGTAFSTNVLASTVQSSFWTTSTTVGANSNDAGKVELGVKFSSSIAGTIKSIRFYKYANNTGTHTGNLWSSTGTLLASGTFVNETASGWQQMNLATPVAINPGTIYIASYLTPTGNYAFTSPGFSSSFTNGPLTASGGSNGVYKYGGGFPNQNFRSTNYWVDVVFESNGTQSLTLTGITDSLGCNSSGSLGTVTVTPTDCTPPLLTSAAMNNIQTAVGNELGQNYPNPFHNNTSFNYSIAVAGVVRITLYDMNGRVVRILVNGWQSEGTHNLIFDTGSIIPGLYYYRMETGAFRDTKKMTIL